MGISLFSTWATGVLNGYNLQETGLPNSIKYGTMVLATSIHIVKGLGNISMTEIPKMKPGITFASLMVVAPLAVGSTFCIGNYFGKAIRYVEDREKYYFDGSNKSKVIML